MAELGLGLAALGRPLYMNLGHGQDVHGATSPSALQERCHQVLDCAQRAEVRYLDCARSYGRGERFLGRWLRSRAVEPGAVKIASKWGYRYTADWDPQARVQEVKDHSVDHLRVQFAKTTEHLWEYLDVYQIHSATFETGVLEDRAVRKELARLRDERGLAIGLSVTGELQSEVIDRALDIEVDSMPLFTVVQATFNLLERSAQKALGRAKAEGRLVVVKEGLANGRLAGRATGVDRPGIKLADRIAEVQRSTGLTHDAVCLGALLESSEVDIVLSGASSVTQLESNLEAAKLSSEAAQSLWSETEGESPAAYWTHRKSLPWT